MKGLDMNELEAEKGKLLKMHLRGILTEREYEQRVFELDASTRPERPDWQAIWNQCLKNS